MKVRDQKYQDDLLQNTYFGNINRPSSSSTLYSLPQARLDTAQRHHDIQQEATEAKQKQEKSQQPHIEQSQKITEDKEQEKVEATTKDSKKVTKKGIPKNTQETSPIEESKEIPEDKDKEEVESIKKVPRGRRKGVKKLNMDNQLDNSKQNTYNLRSINDCKCNKKCIELEEKISQLEQKIENLICDYQTILKKMEEESAVDDSIKKNIQEQEERKEKVDNQEAQEENQYVDIETKKTHQSKKHKQTKAITKSKNKDKSCTGLSFVCVDDDAYDDDCDNDHDDDSQNK